MILPRHVRTFFTVCFWTYGIFLVLVTHAPVDDVQFLVRAADFRLLDPDKHLHIGAYGVLGLLAALAYGGRWRTAWTAMVVLVPLLAAWGMVDELTQPVFGRTAAVDDWICDVIGAAIGLGVGLAASRWLTARLRSAA